MSATLGDITGSTDNAPHNVVLVVAKDGAVCNVIELPSAVCSDTITLSTIDDLWPADITQAIRNSLKRTLRDRGCHSEEVERHNQDCWEFIYVAQGPDRVLLIGRDLSNRQRTLSRIQSLAYTDIVTGLPNREYLLSELQKIADVQKLKEGRLALICINVGQFGDFGYPLSTAQQNAVLKSIAANLSLRLRGLNQVSDENYERTSLLARTDFRQFGIVLPSIESGEDAEAVASRILEDLQQPIVVQDRDIGIRPTAGIALFPQDGTDPTSLFENAVSAVEDASQSKEAVVKLHSGTLRLRSLQRQDLEIELKTALERDEYALNFLPIVDAATSQPKIIEALLRWPDSLLGTQTTRKIVQVAERTGLILSIGDWVLHQACEQLQAWHGLGLGHLRMAINVSQPELISDGFVDRITRIVDETDTARSDVDIEIREDLLTRESRKDYSICKSLRSLGFRIVVDDFGVGTCSLANLARAPIDAIKIANSLVANIVTNERDRAACAAAISMADKLAIDAVAVGVESESQAHLLVEHDCQWLQGFYFGQPRSSDEMLSYLNANDVVGRKINA